MALVSSLRSSRTTLAFVLALAATACTQSSGAKSGASAALLDPSAANDTAPEEFAVKFETTEGAFVVQVHRAWAPLGADRFYNLAKLHYYDGVGFFRAIDGFMVQFGLHGDPAVTRAWRTVPIEDDPPSQSNGRGTVTFATSGPDSRTTQIFINYGNNVQLDRMGFAPFGEVTEGMDVVESLYKGYGEGAPNGTGPDQLEIEREGNAYLKRSFPELDYIERASIIE